MALGLFASIGGSLLSGIFGSRSANRAADAQVEAAEMAVEEQRRQYDTTRQDLAQWRDTGGDALAAYAYELGLAPRPGSAAFGQMASQNSAPVTIVQERAPVAAGPAFEGNSQGAMFGRPNFDTEGGTNGQMPLYAQMQQRFSALENAPMQYRVGDQVFGSMEEAQAHVDSLSQPAGGDFEYRGFQETPGYQYALDQGQQAIARNAAARGMNLSGATLQALQAHRQGMAQQEYDTYLNRLASTANVGQTATNQTAAFGANAANNIGNAYTQMGQARASGYAGQNAAFQGALNNIGTAFGYAQSGMFGPTPGFGITPNPAGLSAWGY